MHKDPHQTIPIEDRLRKKLSRWWNLLWGVVYICPRFLVLFLTFLLYRFFFSCSFIFCDFVSSSVISVLFVGFLLTCYCGHFIVSSATRSAKKAVLITKEVHIQWLLAVPLLGFFALLLLHPQPDKAKRNAKICWCFAPVNEELASQLLFLTPTSLISCGGPLVPCVIIYCASVVGHLLGGGCSRDFGYNSIPSGTRNQSKRQQFKKNAGEV